MYKCYEYELSVVCCFEHVGLFLIPGGYKVFDSTLLFLFYYSIILLFIMLTRSYNFRYQLYAV